MEHLLTVPMKRPPMTANDQRRAHWTAVRKAKEQVGETVYWLARQAKLKGLAPSVVAVTWFTPDKRNRDSDSLGPFLKAALDGLVKAGVWPDDHSDWIVETRMAVNKSQTRNPRIEIRIAETMREPEMRWEDDAVCREVGTELFFSEGRGDPCNAARQVCTICPVKVECLEAAMREEYGLAKNYRHGVRGGYTPNQRARLALVRGEEEEIVTEGSAA